MLAVELAIIVWNLFDRSTPCWDTAAHRLNALAAYDLLSRAHFRSIDWYRQMLTISPLYPPLFYWLSALFKLLLGRLAETEQLLNCVSSGVLVVTSYHLALLTTKDRVASTISCLLPFLSVLLFAMTHTVLLDCAATAAVTVCLYFLLRWSGEMNLPRSLALGCLFATALLIRTNDGAFFVGPVIFDTFMWLRKKDYRNVSLLVLSIGFSAFLLAPWMLFAGPVMLDFVHSIQSQNLGSHTGLAEFVENAARYSVMDSFYWLLSPPMYVGLIAALVALFFRRPIGKERTFLVLSIVSGIFICSGFHWVHQSRYVLPLVVPEAVLLGDFLSWAWFTKTKVAIARVLNRVVVVALVALMVLYAFCMSFVPYPVRLPAWLDAFILKHHLIRSYLNADLAQMSTSYHPLPYADWRMQWAVDTIEQASGGRFQTVMVLPDGDTVGPSPLTYMILSKPYHLSLQICRTVLVNGDSVKSKPALDAHSADWFILKTGSDQGRPFVDQTSATAYETWCQVIRHDATVDLHALHPLPDGSNLELYHRRR